MEDEERHKGSLTQEGVSGPGLKSRSCFSSADRNKELDPGQNDLREFWALWGDPASRVPAAAQDTVESDISVLESTEAVFFSGPKCDPQGEVIPLMWSYPLGVKLSFRDEVIQ
jgi:hypothetical protein